MDLPTIIVEFGQRRQRVQLKKFHLTIEDLLDLFSQLFHRSFNLNQYEIWLDSQRLHSMIKLNFTQLDNYQRFRIQSKSSSSSVNSKKDDINSLKQRLSTASMEIMKVAVLINSIHQNYQSLIKTLTDKDNHVQKSANTNLVRQDLIVPPGFKPLSNSSFPDSQSTDEGIDRDRGSLSIFESAHSDHELESIYLECREDVTIINQPKSILPNDNSKFQWRHQPYRSHLHWNSNQVKYKWNSKKEQFGEKPRSKKPVNPYKTPLPPEKKKNIPCKYAAGGTCKRGSQCRFIHVV